MQIDKQEINYKYLDNFLSKTRIFLTYAKQDSELVEPFLLALEKAGFQVFRDAEFPLGENWSKTIENQIIKTSKNGWIIAFVSRASLTSNWVKEEISLSKTLGAKLVPVILEQASDLLLHLPKIKYIDGTRNMIEAPENLVRLLMSR